MRLCNTNFALDTQPLDSLTPRSSLLLHALVSASKHQGTLTFAARSRQKASTNLTKHQLALQGSAQNN